MPTLEELPVTPEGGAAFVVNAAYFYRDAGEAPASLTLVIHNRAGKWISPEIIRSNGSFTTAGYHVNNGEDWQVTEAIQIYANNSTYVKRWAPNVIGIGGDGGGIVRFNLPADAKGAQIELTVVG